MATISLRTATLLGLMLPLTQAFMLRPVSVKGGSNAILSPLRRESRHIRRPVSMQAPGSQEAEECDVVVVGSGIAGLTCASVLAKYGLDVIVCESHYHAGGCAHSFDYEGFKFDSGPSLFSGLSIERSPNPLKHVLDFIEEEVDWLTYDTWGVVLPEGAFDATIGPGPFQDILRRFGGPKAFEEWDALMEKMAPLSVGAMALPPGVLRNGPGVLLTAVPFLGALLKTLPVGPKLVRPFSEVLDEVGVTDTFIRNWLSLLCFLLQGMKPDGTQTAVMAYMLADWYRPNVKLDYPRGGTGALIDKLVHGVTKRGGKVMLNAHVERILVDNQSAAGVALKGGKVVKARKGVVSNASIWNTKRLLPSDLQEATATSVETMDAVPQTPSFLHLHLGLDATGLGPLNCHYAVVDDWSKPIDAPGNVVIISIPSLLDPSLAPAGCHCLHAYTAGNEPYAPFEGLDRRSDEYKRLKAERAEVLWRAVEKVIPDVRSRLKLSLVGTPLTHERFLRRDRGTYGPAIRAGSDEYPPNQTPIPGLTLCGDSVFPGIGVPAVAASGCIAANNLVPFWKHLQLVRSIRMP